MAHFFYTKPGLHVEVYDTMTDPLPQSAKDVDFFLQHRGKAEGSILEIACGTGRVAWQLAEAGVEVVGLDLSKAMLHIAETKRKNYSEKVSDRMRFVYANMSTFDFDEQFALIVVAFRSFQILSTPEEQLKTLANIRRHLKPNGRLIIDIFDPKIELLRNGQRSSPLSIRQVIHPKTENVVNIVAVGGFNNFVTQMLTEHWRFTEYDSEGKVLREEDEVLRMRWTYRYEMRHLLERSGFKVLKEYSDYSESPPAYGKEQIWVVERNN